MYGWNVLPSAALSSSTPGLYVTVCRHTSLELPHYYFWGVGGAGGAPIRGKSDRPGGSVLQYTRSGL